MTNSGDLVMAETDVYDNFSSEMFKLCKNVKLNGNPEMIF